MLASSSVTCLLKPLDSPGRLIKLLKKVDNTPQQSKIFGVHDDIYILKTSEVVLHKVGRPMRLGDMN